MFHFNFAQINSGLNDVLTFLFMHKSASDLILDVKFARDSLALV